MSTLTMKDVAPQLNAFNAKYGRATSLTMDEIEAIIASAESDMSDDDFAEAFFEAETPEPSDDRSDGGDNSSDSAYEVAKLLSDPAFVEHLETNAKAALENKRGAAVIRRDLVRLAGLEVIATIWPVPGTTTKTAQGNRRPHKYNKTVTDITTGETKTGTDNGDWYADAYDASQDGKALLAKLDSLAAAKRGETGPHILPEHAKIAGDEIRLVAQKSKLDGFRTNKKNAIIRAVNLVQRMHRINTETEMTCELITVDGTPEGEPEDSNKLVYAYNSKDRKQFRILTIGQLLALDVDKAKGSGGTYVAVIGTTKRPPKKGTGVAVQNIGVKAPKELDDAMSATANYFDGLTTDTKATNALLTYFNGAGTDDFILSCNTVMDALSSYLDKPTIAKRLQGLLVDGKKRKVA